MLGNRIRIECISNNLEIALIENKIREKIEMVWA